MYKDKEAQKEATRLAVQRHRSKAKGITEVTKEIDVIPENVIPETWYPNKSTDSKGKAIEPITLSDGQKFYPDPGISYPVIKKVTKGTKEAYSPSGGKISLDKLIDKGWREFINYVSQNLKPAYQEDLRIGVGGVTVSEAQSLVECVS
jgi:hypothetical protein